MENKKTLTRALGGVLVGGMLLFGGIAFAGDANNQSTKIPGKTPSVKYEEKRPGMMNMKTAQKQQKISESLIALVGKGTITQEQADKVLKGFAAAQKDREDLWQKMQGMTKAERRQYLQTNQGNLKQPLNQLVTTGTITQEQAKAIKKELSQQKGCKGRNR